MIKKAITTKKVHLRVLAPTEGIGEFAPRNRPKAALSLVKRAPYLFLASMIATKSQDIAIYLAARVARHLVLANDSPFYGGS